MNTTVPHAQDLIRVMNRNKLGQTLVLDKILSDCVNSIISAAKRGEKFTVFVVPCFKSGYPAYNIDEATYWVLNQLLQKRYNALPFKRNHLFIQWCGAA